MELKKVLVLIVITILLFISLVVNFQLDSQIKEKDDKIRSMEKDLKSPFIGGVENILINIPKGNSTLQFSVRNPSESNTIFWYVLDFRPSQGIVDVEITGGRYLLSSGINSKVIDNSYKRIVNVSKNKRLIVIKDSFDSPPDGEFHEIHAITIEIKPFISNLNKSFIKVSFYQGENPPEGLYKDMNPVDYTIFQ